MLKLGETDPRLIDRLGSLAARVVEDALASGLTWDQAVVALGIAAKAMSAKAASQGGAAPSDYALHAELDSSRTKCELKCPKVIMEAR